jgi:hypothetical protein
MSFLTLRPRCLTLSIEPRGFLVPIVVLVHRDVLPNRTLLSSRAGPDVDDLHTRILTYPLMYPRPRPRPTRTFMRPIHATSVKIYHPAFSVPFMPERHHPTHQLLRPAVTYDVSFNDDTHSRTRSSKHHSVSTLL